MTGLFLGIGIGAGHLAAVPPVPGVHVTVDPASVEYGTFPRGEPPPGLMFPLEEQQGLTKPEFVCWVSPNVSYPQPTGAAVTATVVSVDVHLKLQVAIWTAVGVGPEVRRHEETHRRIAEHFVAAEVELARRLATTLLGKQLSAPTANRTAVLLQKLHDLSKPVADAWSRETVERNDFAQDRFDEITRHGMDPISPEKAMAQALADEAARPRDDGE